MVLRGCPTTATTVRSMLHVGASGPTASSLPGVSFHRVDLPPGGLIECEGMCGRLVNARPIPSVFAWDLTGLISHGMSER